MLLDEFLKEHQKVEKLESTVAMQEKNFKVTIAQQQKQIEALTAIVQKVSDQIALRNPAPQLVANPWRQSLRRCTPRRKTIDRQGR